MARTQDDQMNKMWRTKSCRFNAGQRLRTIHALSIWTTSILAFYVFCMSLAAIFIPYYNLTSDPSLHSQYSSLATLILSVFLIILTLLESSKRYLNDADAMLKSGNEIGEIYNVYQSYSDDEKEKKRTDVARQYSKILKVLPVNHKDIDFALFRIQNASELGIGNGKFLAILLKFLFLSLIEYGLFLFMLVSPLVYVVVLVI